MMNVLPQLEQLAHEPVLLIATDSDGTIAPIVSDPAAAKAVERIMTELRRVYRLEDVAEFTTARELTEPSGSEPGKQNRCRRRENPSERACFGKTNDTYVVLACVAHVSPCLMKQAVDGVEMAIGGATLILISADDLPFRRKLAIGADRLVVEAHGYGVALQ
jgi:hypothetical protein